MSPKSESDKPRYPQLFDDAPVGLLIVSREFKVRDVNRHLCRNLGREASAMRGRDVFRFLVEAGRPVARHKILAEEKQLELDLLHRDGRVIHALVNLTPAPGGSAWILACIDITERKRMERELSELQRMEAIGRLAGGVAHDINSLLTGIIANADFLLEDLPEDSPLREETEEILDLGIRTAQLIQQLLAFSRQQIRHPEPLNLTNAVFATSKLLRRLIGEDIELVTLADAALGQTIADPSQIEQILLNLALNARAAMPNGGRLTIETRRTRIRSGDARPDVKPGWYTALDVRDTGVGMPEEVRERIFEPFFTTKDTGKGLGLAIVYGIVQQGGGHIEVSSEVGVGTTFRLLFPEADLKTPRTARRRPMQTPSRQRTILVIEASERIRRFLVSLLERSGFEVLEADGARQALEVGLAREGALDLLVVGIDRDEIDEKALAGLAQKHPSLEVLFLLGRHRREALASEGLTESASLQDGLSPQLILEEIQEALASL